MVDASDSTAPPSAAPPVLRMGRNRSGRDFVCGDIHGCFGALNSALCAHDFQPDRDRLFSVGDLVDRGPDSPSAFSWLDKPWFFAVRGNHEEMALDAARTYARLTRQGIDVARELRHVVKALTTRPEDTNDVSADARMQSAAARLEDLMPLIAHVLNGGAWLPRFLAHHPDSLAEVERFTELPVAIEIETRSGHVGITHADVWGSDWSIHCKRIEAGSARTISFAQWSRRRARNVVRKGQRQAVTERAHRDCTVAGIDHVFVGHNVVPGTPVPCGNMVFVDTGAPFRGGHLSLVCIDDWIASTPSRAAQDLKK